MGSHGARNILSISRSNPQHQQIQDFIREMEAKGVRLIAKKCDITSEGELASVIKDVAQGGLPPIRGVVQSAMVLKVSTAYARNLHWQS